MKDIVDVVGSYFKLSKTVNGLFVSKCPFHKGKIKSFIVNKNLQTWHCFACGRHGGAREFIMAYEEVGLDTATKMCK